MEHEAPLILHVDDEQDVLAVTKLALEEIGGLDVVQCSSGREALIAAQEHSPDLLLLDVMMPELDGIETLRRLREIPRFEQIPVIFMTAKVTKQDKELLMECGADSIIGKPFDPITVASEIIEIWKKSFQIRSLRGPSV